MQLASNAASRAQRKRGCSSDLQAFEATAALLLAADPSVTQLQDATSEQRRELVQRVRELTTHAIRIDRRWILRASFIWWSGDERSSAAQAARVIVADLSRIYGMEIDLQDYVTDRKVTDSTLRFQAVLQ
ncbi:MAG: hypothetical protein ACI85K_003694 [Hyphomicrobiaceae bacterium]|jgi:hypothetical protein